MSFGELSPLFRGNLFGEFIPLRTSGNSKWSSALVVLTACAAVAVRLPAEEPAQRFLEALRERGYYDTALEYIETLRDNELVPVAVRVTVPYERGMVLMALGRTERNPERQDELLRQAETAFKAFIQEHPNHPLVPATRRELGNLLVIRARVVAAAAESGGGGKLKQQAISLLDSAGRVFQASLDDMKPQLQSLKAVPAGETELLQLRKTLRDEYFQTLITKAGVIEEKGDLLEPGSEAAKKAYREAAEAFETLYEDYRTKLGGLYSRMYQARCLRKMGDLDKAVALLDADILGQSESKETFREMRTRALTLAIEIWLDPKQAKYLEAVRRGTEWITKQRPNERGRLEWLRLKLVTAKAMKAYADKLGYEGGNQTKAKQQLTQARDLARSILRYPSPLRQEAREFLSQLPGGLEVAKDSLPDNFEDAEAQAKETLTLLDETRKQVEEAKAKLASAQGDDRAEIAEQLKELEKTLAEQLERAEQLTRQALKLGGEDLGLEKRTSFLYYLAFLAVLADRPHDAYVFSSYVARRYPDASNARPSAKIAIQAAVMLYERAAKDDREFELGLLREIAQYTFDTWPEEPEGEFALGVLIPFEIQDGHLDRAEALSVKIPAGSAKWSEIQMRLGVAYWREVLDAKQKLREAESGADPQAWKRVEPLRGKAIGYLEQGTKSIGQVSDMTALHAQSVVFLVQAYLDEGKVDEALQWLENNQRGLLAFVESPHAAALPASFPFAVYRLTLQAFVQRLASGGSSSEQGDLLERLKQVMGRLDKLTGEGPEAARKKLAVYYSLTTELANEIKAQAEPARRASLAQGAQVLLSAVAEQASDPTFLRWAGDTLSSLAASLQGPTASATEARQLYREAARAYQRLLKQPGSASQPLAPATLQAVQYKLAVALQESGDLPQAIEVFRDLLKVKGSMVVAQVAAAQAYEMWAERDKRPELYEKALVGAYPAGKRKSNVIWGWIRLARTTMRYPKFRETFFEAQYHTAYCQLRMAEAERDGAKSKRLARSAKLTIIQTQRAFPEMASGRWRSRFDSLMKRIQKRLGESAVGLKAISKTKKKSRRS